MSVNKLERATKLIVPDGAVLTDPQFKAISMTSDKWLEIEPIPPTNLLDFLSARRQEGFRILAVEQTSASVPLQSYTFPARFVLVLGNEAAGIPPEILHVVDDCIEIPQNGMIRSLNVHVCGSIVLWESRRQIYVRDPAAVGVSSGVPPTHSPANTIS
jgi:tRNA G18 (ribose-2'-O)-methylase SpoU